MSSEEQDKYTIEEYISETRLRQFYRARDLAEAELNAKGRYRLSPTEDSVAWANDHDALTEKHFEQLIENDEV